FHEVSASPVTQTHRSIAIESNHQLFEWVLPPLVICPFGAHRRISAQQANSLRHVGIPFAAKPRCATARRAMATPLKTHSTSHGSENIRSLRLRSREEFRL